MIYQTELFLMTLNYLLPRCQGRATIWCWISQKRYEMQT